MLLYIILEFIRKNCLLLVLVLMISNLTLQNYSRILVQKNPFLHKHTFLLIKNFYQLIIK